MWATLELRSHDYCQRVTGILVHHRWRWHIAIPIEVTPWLHSVNTRAEGYDTNRYWLLLCQCDPVFACTGGVQMGLNEPERIRFSPTLRRWCTFCYWCCLRPVTSTVVDMWQNLATRDGDRRCNANSCGMSFSLSLRRMFVLFMITLLWQSQCYTIRFVTRVLNKSFWYVLSKTYSWRHTFHRLS